MKLKKTTINHILDSYSTRPQEFESLGIENRFKSKIIQGYTITIEPEKAGSNNDYTGRIIVHHSSSRGKRVFNDIWECDSNGNHYWLCRNPINVPLSDAESYRNLEKELNQVKAAARELKKEHDKTVALLEEQLEINRSLKNNQAIIDTNIRKSGRPKETEKQLLKANEIKALLSEGKTNEEIMIRLNLRRATFFRLKKMIKSDK